jgi:chaperone modulatory protein CbpM
MSEHPLIPVAEILDENLELSLTDLTQRYAVEVEIIIELVQEGVLEPQGPRPEEWRFRGPDLIRLRRAINLQRDLELNLPGIALALDLLDELEELRAKIERMERLMPE